MCPARQSYPSAVTIPFPCQPGEYGGSWFEYRAHRGQRLSRNPRAGKIISVKAFRWGDMQDLFTMEQECRPSLKCVVVPTGGCHLFSEQLCTKLKQDSSNTIIVTKIAFL